PREQSGEIGCAPHISASRRISRPVPSGLRRNSRRSDRSRRRAERVSPQIRDPVKPRRSEIDDSAATKCNGYGGNALSQSDSGKRKWVASHHTHLVFVYLDEVEAPHPR